MLLADDLIDAAGAVLHQMAEYAERAASCSASERVARGYGQVRHRRDRKSREPHRRVTRIVEKPARRMRRRISRSSAVTSSRRGSSLTCARPPGAGGEIQLTDGIAALLAEEPVFAYAFEGRRYDCGSKLGYLEATVEYGLKHEALGEKFSEYLVALAAKLTVAART